MRDRRERDARDEELGEVYPTGVKPGAATLSSRLPVQRKASAGARPASAPAPSEPFAFVQAYGGGAVADTSGAAFPDEAPTAWMAAQVGTSGTAGALPHLGTIQPLFGKHDVSGVRAYTDDAAASGARAMGAEAFATGDRVAFGATPTLHTAAHEAAHVVQQRAGVALKGGVGASGDVYEQHADAVADQVVRGESAEQLLDQMAGGGGGGGTRAIQRVDQRAGTQLPTAAQQSAIANELYPSAAPVGGVAQTWDGAVGQPNHLANRTALINEMHTAMAAHLTARMNGPNGNNGITAIAGQARVPIQSLEGAGRAAKADADAHFSQYTTAAALTTAQETARASYAISADPAAPGGQNLFDAQNPAHRATVNMAINPTDLASWISETDPACVAAINTHHLDRRNTTQRDFLRQQIIAPFVAAHDADLRLYDQHGFAMSNPDTGQIVLPTSLPLGMSTAPGVNGAPSDAERSRKWRGWRTMVHEYIHQLEHPALRAWPGSNRTISEGFCEYFTKQVLLPLLPSAAGADVPRRTAIEGGDHGAPSDAIIGGPYSAGSYQNYLQRAENIEGQLGGAPMGQRNAMKAIFFQGHIELLGYDRAGNPLTAPAGPQDEVTLPATLTTYAQVHTALNVPEADLRAANPGRAEPLSGRLHAPGCREHRVVQASDGAGSRRETATVIATQHDVTVAALTAANPGVNFAALAVDQIVIVPRH